jgi:hypothetical protein
LLFQESPFEKVHDLAWLAGQCALIDAEFQTIVPRVDPLSAFAVRFRYPGPCDPTVEEVRQALAVVEDTWRFVLARLPAGAWD